MDEELLFFDQTLLKIEFLFRYSGINIKIGKQNSKNTKARIIYILNSICLLQSLYGETYWFLDGIRTGKDFLELTNLAPCLFAGSLAFIKSVFLLVNEKHVHKLIDKLRKMEIQEKQRRQSSKKYEIIKEEKIFLDMVLNTINILYILVMTTFVTIPLVLMAVKYYETKELKPLLPFLILYPFDPFQMKIWPFVYLHQIWSEVAAYLLMCSVDMFFFVSCTYIRIQFRLLQHNIENIIISNNKMKVLEDEDFTKKFKDLIEWHQDLIESAHILEIIYSKSTLLNFLSSSLVICLCGFNIVTLDGDLTFIASFISFLLMSLAQVFFLCYFADTLTTSSADISKAVYSSQWYMAEAKIGKKLLIVSTRALSPCKLTASGFANVSLKSFMRVLSTSYSYFALLQTMYRN